MHDQAMDYIRRHATPTPGAVLDIGGRDLNGSPRELFPGADPYVVLDIEPGPNVDIVADAATWTPDRAYDVVVCAEVFEHTPTWPQIVETAFEALSPGGKLIITCAGPGRFPHSGKEAKPDLDPGEWYRNVSADELLQVLRKHDFVGTVIETLGSDLRATAVKSTLTG